MKALGNRRVMLFALVCAGLVGIWLNYTPRTEVKAPNPFRMAGNADESQEIDRSDILRRGGDTQLDLNHPLAFAVRDGRAVITHCSERIVEIPFTHRNLPYPFRGRVLDVGYRESELTFQTASLGFETWGIDIRAPLVRYPGVRYVKGDVCSYPLPRGYFDVVIALSTVEHIGLAFIAYDNTTSDPDGDVHAMQSIAKAIKPTGRVILTVPFGRRGQTSWYRVYDHNRLLALLEGAGLKPDREDYWYQEDTLRWSPGPWSRVEQIDSLSHNVRGVACIVARRK